MRHITAAVTTAAGRSWRAGEPCAGEWEGPFGELSLSPILRRLPRTAVLDLSRATRSRAFEPGHELAPEIVVDSMPVAGLQDETVFVVTSGLCSAHRSLPDGRRVVVGIRGPGEIAGIERIHQCPESPPSTRHAAAATRVVLPGWTALGWVHAIPVSVAGLRRALERSPEARAEADALVFARIAELETAMAESLLETRERLSRTLRRLALRFGAPTALGHALDLPLNQGTLALLVGSTRETVNRVLGSLAAEGVVSLRDGIPVLIRSEPGSEREAG
jgi:CRP/FNR family cyclic AMP-dependent transcriptional regulator